ncbi:MAG: hypothetical protein LUQ33_08740 [Methanoregulaceae archaeon]|nr:hypothetical protein [Methanoregulaceae archaeon]
MCGKAESRGLRRPSRCTLHQRYRTSWNRNRFRRTRDLFPLSLQEGTRFLSADGNKVQHGDAPY